jgi:polysaccharide deacetylase 2 family uncharacterized protein YibQ
MAKKTFSMASFKRMLWHACFFAAMLVAIAAAGMLWYKGGKNGQEAIKDGRRVIVRLDTGKIEGWQAGMPLPEEEKAPEPKAEEKPEAQPEETKPVELKPAEPEKAADAPAEVKAEPAPVVPVPETPVDKPPAEKKEEPVAEKPAEVPVAAPEKVQEKPAEKIEDKAPEKPVEKPAEAADAPKPEEKTEDKTAKPAGDVVAGAVVPSVSAVRGVNDALTEKSKDGLLPKIAADGTKPWKYYSKSTEYKGDYPVIAIIVTGLGTSKAATEAAIKLPENITLSFSPYARNVESWATAARVTGHEVMLDLPLQPADYPASDPGPYGLLTDSTPEANEKKLQWLLSRFGAFTGVLTPLNDGFVNDTAALAGLFDAVARRGLIMALSRDVVKNEAHKMLEESDSPVLVADVILDEDLSETSINTRIATLQQRAKERGYAVGVAQNYPITIKQLSALPERFSKEGFMLMPASYVAKLRFK